MTETMHYESAPAYQRLVKKWAIMGSNIDQFPDGCNWVGNYLLSAHSGVDTEGIVARMVEKLEEYRLFSFSEKPGYIVHSYLRHHDDVVAAQLELVHLWDSIQDAARFKETFRGLLLLDVTSWLKNADDLAFRQMIELISSKSADLITVFSVFDASHWELEELYRNIAVKISLEPLYLAADDVQTMSTHLKEQFKQYGVDVYPGALQLLGEHCMQQIHNRKRVCQQNVEGMVLELARIALQNQQQRNKLSEQDVVNYIERRSLLADRGIKMIGFAH